MDLKRERLAELVIHLADCAPAAAVAAIDAAMGHAHAEGEDDSLEVVARAMVLLRRPVDLRDRVALDVGPQDAKVGGRRSAHGAADSS